MITYPSTATNSFVYNGEGLRVSKTDSSGTSACITDGTAPASPVLKDARAVYTPGLSERAGSTSSFYHGDALGSTRGITSASQSVTDAILYDAFGATVSRTGSTPTPFGFVGAQGYQSDADSGLMLLGNRYYDASIGRFISSDPAKAGSNWHAYCENDPLDASDPSGFDISSHRPGTDEPYPSAPKGGGSRKSRPRQRGPSGPTLPGIIRAVIAVGGSAINESNSDGTEYSGIIWYWRGRYGSSEPVSSGSGTEASSGAIGATPPGLPDSATVGYWHTHAVTDDPRSTNGEIANYGSEADISGTNNVGKPSFVVSGNGGVYIILPGKKYRKVPGYQDSYRIPQVGNVRIRREYRPLMTSGVWRRLGPE